MTLTHERLRQVLRYDESTGIFRRLVSTSNRSPIGSIAGAKMGGGYIYIGIDGARHRAHRLAWLYIRGCWPTGEVDHINGRRDDNRFENLRDVSGRINRQNVRAARSHNASSGVLGVDRLPSGKFRAKLGNNGHSIYLGVFDTASEAHASYLSAKRELHAGCTL